MLITGYSEIDFVAAFSSVRFTPVFAGVSWVSIFNVAGGFCGDSPGTITFLSNLVLYRPHHFPATGVCHTCKSDSVELEELGLVGSDSQCGCRAKICKEQEV